MPSEHKIGLLAAASYTVGNMVGSGIFISPTSILKESGSVGSSLLVWGVCGALSLLGALCYIELATSIHQSGADLAYVSYVGWRPIAFAFIWINVVALPCGAAIIAEAFGQYCLQTIQLRPSMCIDEGTAFWARKLIGFGLVLGLTYMNLRSLRRIMAPFQVAATACKVLAMSTVVVVGFYYLFFEGSSESFQQMMIGTKWSPGRLVLAIYAGLWAFSGWEILNFGTEEIKNPKWTFPLATFGGTIFVTIIYLAINIAYFSVLTPSEMLESDAVAATFSNRALSAAPMVVPIFICVNMVGTLNTNIFVASRYYFAASRSGHMPTALGLLSTDCGSPRPAVLLYGVLVIIVTFVGELDDLINVYTFCISCQRVFTIAALMKIRLDNIPVHEDAIQMPFVVITFFGAFSVVLVIVPIYQMTMLSAIGIAVLVCSFAAYFVLERFRTRLIRLTIMDARFARFCQKLLLVMPDDFTPWTRRYSHTFIRRRRPESADQ